MRVSCIFLAKIATEKANLKSIQSYGYWNNPQEFLKVKFFIRNISARSFIPLRRESRHTKVSSFKPGWKSSLKSRRMFSLKMSLIWVVVSKLVHWAANWIAARCAWVTNDSSVSIIFNWNFNYKNMTKREKVWNILPLKFIKAGSVWCGGARDTHWATYHKGVTSKKTKEFLKSPCFFRS